MGKKKVTLSVDSRIYSDFQKYCEDNAIMLSKKIEIFMKNIIKSKGKKNFLMSIFFMLFLIFLSVLVSAGIFQDLNFGDFNNGVYNWTFYNSSGFVQLNSSRLNGTYTSRIFDSSGSSLWNNLSYQSSLLSMDYLYAVDSQANVLSSNNNGVSWQVKNLSYAGSTPGDTQDLFSN